MERARRAECRYANNRPGGADGSCLGRRRPSASTPALTNVQFQLCAACHAPDLDCDGAGIARVGLGHVRHERLFGQDVAQRGDGHAEAGRAGVRRRPGRVWKHGLLREPRLHQPGAVALERKGPRGRGRRWRKVNNKAHRSAGASIRHREDLRQRPSCNHGARSSAIDGLLGVRVLAHGPATSRRLPHRLHNCAKRRGLSHWGAECRAVGADVHLERRSLGVLPSQGWGVRPGRRAGLGEVEARAVLNGDVLDCAVAGAALSGGVVSLRSARQGDRCQDDGPPADAHAACA